MVIGIIALSMAGIPLFLVLGLLSLALFACGGIDVTAVAVEIYRMASTPTLSTIPLFTLAGYLLARSHSPQRILNLTRALFGFLPGGVGIVVLVMCAFFTAFTGASGVTIIALGALLLPMLRKQGFSEKFSLGLITTSGSLGLLFPPSLPIILYGLVAKVDIEKLFQAGLIPGFFLILLLASVVIIRGGKGVARIPFSWQELKSSLWQARYEIPLPIIVLFSLYNGWTTPTETALITLIYCFLMECFFYRDLKVRDLPPIIAESMSLVGSVLLILCCAMGFTSYLIDAEIPLKILDFLQTFITNKYMFLLLLNLFLLVVGCLMDIFSAIVVIVPLIIPVATQFGVNPLHLAIIFITNLEIGYLTPPIGMNLFLSSLCFKKPVSKIFWNSFPFVIILLLALAIITYVPYLSLALVTS